MRDSVLTSGKIAWAHSLSPQKTPPIYYYPFYNGVQLIEVGYYEQSLSRGAYINTVHPHSGSSYHNAIQNFIPNGFLLRNEQGRIIENYGVNDLKKLELHPAKNCPVSFYHKQRLHPNSRLGAIDLFRFSLVPKQRLSGHPRNAYIVNNESGYSVVDTFGVVRFKNYEYIYKSGDYFTVRSEGKYGLFDASFKQLIPFKYTKGINWAKNDIFIAYDSTCTLINRNDVLLDTTRYENLRVVNWTIFQIEYKLNGKHGLLDRVLHRVTEPVYNPLKKISDRLYTVTDSSNRMAFLNSDGLQTTEYAYLFNNMKIRDDGFYEVYAHQSTKGSSGKRSIALIDTLGFEKIAPKYERLGNFADGVATAILNDVYTLINKKGRALTSKSYSRVGGTYISNCYRVQLNGKWGLIDSLENELLPIQYTKILCVQDSMVVYEGANGKYGYINLGTGGDIPPQFDFAYCFIQGIARVSISRKYGLINKSGKEITGFKYDVASAYNGISGIVKKKGRWGAIDNEGNIIIPLRYENLVEIDNNGLKFYNDEDDEVILRR
jgi:hypothetical protein